MPALLQRLYNPYLCFDHWLKSHAARATGALHRYPLPGSVYFLRSSVVNRTGIKSFDSTFLTILGYDLV